MLFRRRESPLTAHFRQFVRAKESWPQVFERLEFRPKTTHPALRRDVLATNTASVMTSAFRLLAVRCFEIVTAKAPRLVSALGEERLMLECLVYAASAAVNGVQPDADELDPMMTQRQELVFSYALMSLLDFEEIESIFLERVDRYDAARQAPRPADALADAGARVLSQLASGVLNTQVLIRAEDTVAPPLYAALVEFQGVVDEALKEMFSRIVRREMAEEEDGF